LSGRTDTSIGKGEKKTVQFTLRDRGLGIVHESGKHRVVPGKVAVWVGGGQPASRTGLASAAGLWTQFEITGSAPLPD
jgi:beta-glucosidase